MKSMLTLLLLLLTAGSVSAQDSVPVTPAALPVPLPPATPSMQDNNTFCVELQSAYTTELAQQVSAACYREPYMRLLKIRLPQAPQSTPVRLHIKGARQHAQALVDSLRKLPVKLGELQECKEIMNN